MQLHRLALVSLVAIACSDYGFGDDKDVNGPDTGGSADTADTADTADIDDDGPPPTVITDDCVTDTEASFSPGEIYVLSYEPTSASGTLTAGVSGWYHGYDFSLAESGASQTNEESYLRIGNARRPGGEPYWANCEDEWIVDDLDNDGLASGTRVYTGTFWLEAGDNTLTLNHYCPLYMDGYCPEFHETSDSGQTCDAGAANSVHFNGEGLCLQRLDLPEP